MLMNENEWGLLDETIGHLQQARTPGLTDEQVEAEIESAWGFWQKMRSSVNRRRFLVDLRGLTDYLGSLFDGPDKDPPEPTEPPVNSSEV